MDVILIATSLTCGFCKKLRGSGSIYPGQVGWNSDSFKHLLTGGTGKKKYIVYEVLYKSMENNFANIVSLSAWDLVGDKVITYTYTKDNRDGTLLTSNDGKVRKESIVKQDWMKTLKITIPEEVSKFIIMWPMYMVFNSQIWSSGLEGKPLYGHFPGLVVEKKDERWAVKGMAGKIPEINDVLRDIEIGKISLLPPLITPPQEKKETNPCENLHYRLKSK